MSLRGQVMLGIVTTLAFTIVGISLLLSERYVGGGILVFLGMLRGAAAFRQLAHLMEPEDEE